MSELIGFRDGRSHLNYGIYHDRYQRTPDGWKFAERVYEVRYLDTAPLAGSAPQPTLIQGGQDCSALTLTMAEGVREPAG